MNKTWNKRRNKFFKQFLENHKIKWNQEHFHYYSTALTHSSYNQDNNNEQYEFLGDKILNLIVASEVYRNNRGNDISIYHDELEQLINNDYLAKLAKEFGFDKLIYLGEYQTLTNSILADALEAFITAIYFDNGFDEAYDFVKRYIIK